jgi:hypothetical protein
MLAPTVSRPCDNANVRLAPTLKVARKFPDIRAPPPLQNTVATCKAHAPDITGGRPRGNSIKYVARSWLALVSHGGPGASGLLSPREHPLDDSPPSTRSSPPFWLPVCFATEHARPTARRAAPRCLKSAHRFIRGTNSHGIFSASVPEPPADPPQPQGLQYNLDSQCDGRDSIFTGGQPLKPLLLRLL